MSKFSVGSALFAGVIGLAVVGSAMAQDWPTRPVKIVIAVGPGSSGDTLARILAPHLEARWKQPVIVENKPGAGGVIGTEYVVTSTDGHTLLLASQSSLLPKFTRKDLPYDPLTDLVPVFKVINWQAVLVTNAQTATKAKTLREFVALSKSTEKGIFLGGLGRTSLFNMSVAVMNESLGIRYESVDFSSVGAMNLAVLRDDAQFMVNAPASVKGQIENGQIVPLAVINAERYPNYPDIPTLAEAAGYKGYIPLWWAGMMAPKGTPPAVIDRISRDLLAVTTDPAVKKQIETTLSGALVRSSPAAFASELRDEANVWKNVFQKLGIKPE
ncbi:MAG: tripartite tricarboxylate transporter substrate binding protein [Burkholderiales bacterium]|nr:tripartite tricarboxylate transporter substrate binding protein [Burkholderiales bacterium]